MALASASSVTPFGVGTESSGSPPRRRLPRLGSIPKIATALAGSRRSATGDSPADAAAEYSSRRSQRKSRRADPPSTVPPIEHAPLQQPLDVSAGPLPSASLRPTSSGRPASRLSQRLFSRRRPQTEDPATLAAAGERIVPGPARRADAPVTETPRMRARGAVANPTATRSLVEAAPPPAPHRAWERSPMRAMGAIGEEDGERRAIEGALRGAYTGFDTAAGGDDRRGRQRARTDGAVREKTKCEVM
jgi:hypothetical protein